MCGVEVGEPISSSGLAMKTSRSNGQAAALGDDRLERVEPGQQPRLHVGDARAVGDAVLDAERALGRGPGSKTVSMWPMSSARGPPGRPSNVATTVSPSRPAGSGRVSTVAPSSVRNAGDPAARPR